VSAVSPPRVALVQTQAENAGAQQISRLIGADLAARGYDVRQVFLFRRTASSDAAANVEFCAAERPTGPLSVLRLLLRLYRILRTMRPAAVVTFQHYGNIIGASVARLAGARAVIANQTSASVMMPRWAIAIDRVLGRRGAYDRIVVNSAFNAAMFAAHPAGYRNRVLRIDHGFEDKTAGIGKGAARAELGLPLQVPMLGCAARLHPLKQIDAAIALLPLLPGVHLALAGQGRDRPRLERLARDLGVGARVHFLGELAPARIGVFLAALDCFVFPSGAETFGLAPVEAAQAGLPLVANDLEVLREVLGVDGVPCAIFVDARDTAAFAGAVRRVLGDPELAANLGAVGRRLKERFPLGEMTDAYARLIAGLIESGRAHRD
jgi:L-malate glycosyltransferase